jgi:thymidylate kinase
LLVILEGCDGAGKSTLADALAHRGEREGFNVEVWHKGPPETKDPFAEYEGPLINYTPQDDRRLVICDRWHLGEFIYGPVLRGVSRLDWAGLRHIDLRLQALGAVQVIVTTNIETILARLRRRGEDLIPPEKLTIIRDAYQSVYEAFGGRNGHIRLQTNDGDIDRQVNDIWIAAQVQSHAVCMLETSSFPTYVGGIYPNLLLLGEKRGEHPDEAAFPSCFVPYPSTSGAYLLNAMNDAYGPFCRWIGMMNALEDDWVKFWELHDKPFIVALGNNADHVVSVKNILHGCVPHPQYWRRFHHHDRKRYGEMILDAASTSKKVRE